MARGRGRSERLVVRSLGGTTAAGLGYALEQIGQLAEHLVGRRIAGIGRRA